ncbi:MAG TPA: nuclear transport factor 2 family protein [Candidatus Limnocylindria bacterium]|nr:nuclear transport factor 2 family protein [Candidatus Limnocylindria bacterium]
MDEHPNVKVLHRLAEAFANMPDSMAAMEELIADDVEWHEIGRDEPTMGKDALRQRSMEAFGDVDIKADEHDAVANGTHGVQLMNVTATKPDGSSLQYRTAEIYHMKDGKITARWAFSDDTARIMEFFGS